MLKIINKILLKIFNIELVSKKKIDKLTHELKATKEELNKLKSQSYQNNTWVITEIDNDILQWVALNDMGVSYHCIKGNYELSETHFIKSNLNEGMTFVDIGANIGWFTLIAAKAVGPKGRVYAFEPRTYLYKYLLKSIKLNNFDWVKAYNYALGDKDQILHIGWGKKNENLGGTWLITSDEVRSELTEHDFERIEVKRLDQLLQNCSVDLIKIDIEGAEYLAIKGAEQIISESKPTILSEISPTLLKKISGITAEQYIDYMKRLGYECYSLTNGTIGSPIIPNSIKEIINVIFIHKTKI